MPELRAFLDGGGHSATLIRARDWSTTPLGPVQQWPQSLRSALSICLRSANATAIFWGADPVFLYNDAWAEFLSNRHPDAFGRPAREVMADIWPVIGAHFGRAYRDAETVNMIDTLLMRNLGGETFDSYWSYSLLPVASEDGTIGGVLAQARETTEAVLRGRREALILRLGEQLRLHSDPQALVAAAVATVAEEMAAGRVGYAEVDEGAGSISILCCAARDGMDDISGVYPVPKFGGDINGDLQAGRMIRIDDVASDKRLAEESVRRRYDALGVKAALVVPIVSGDRYRAMLFAHHDSPRRWSSHEQELLAAATPHIWREVSRARAEAALRRSEERYRRIFEQASDLIHTADLNQIVTDCNPASAQALGMTREEIIGRSIRDFVSEEGFEQTTRMLREKLEHGGTTQHELEVIAKDGSIRHWEVNSTLTRDDSGEPIGLHAIARDVTERRRAEERQRLLVNELNHRVKNTLALVQGLALQSFRDGRDVDEARTTFQERLAALAAAHDLLTRESWEGATLGALVEDAVGHLNAPEPRIQASGPDVTLAPKAAVSLVMALHELATNAAKYGALSKPDGKVAIAWACDGDRLRIEWRETGGPPVAAPATRGFGLRMIRRALAADMGGGAQLDFAPDGLVCRIEASLAEAAPRTRAAR